MEKTIKISSSLLIRNAALSTYSGGFEYDFDWLFDEKNVDKNDPDLLDSIDSVMYNNPNALGKFFCDCVTSLLSGWDYPFDFIGVSDFSQPSSYNYSNDSVLIEVLFNTESVIRFIQDNESEIQKWLDDNVVKSHSGYLNLQPTNTAAQIKLLQQEIDEDRVIAQIIDFCSWYDYADWYKEAKKFNYDFEDSLYEEINQEYTKRKQLTNCVKDLWFLADELWIDGKSYTNKETGTSFTLDLDDVAKQWFIYKNNDFFNSWINCFDSENLIDKIRCMKHEDFQELAF